MEFDNFKNCKLSTAEILKISLPFKEEKRVDFNKYLYSLLFNTDIQINNKTDLEKIIKSYLSYSEGKFATIEI